MRLDLAVDTEGCVAACEEDVERELADGGGKEVESAFQD